MLVLALLLLVMVLFRGIAVTHSLTRLAGLVSWVLVLMLWVLVLCSVLVVNGR